MQKLLSFDDLVAAGYVNNRVTLSRRIRRGEFPAPIRVGPRNVAWLKGEVDEWEAERITARDAAGMPARSQAKVKSRKPDLQLVASAESAP